MFYRSFPVVWPRERRLRRRCTNEWTNVCSVNAAIALFTGCRGATRQCHLIHSTQCQRERACTPITLLGILIERFPPFLVPANTTDCPSQATDANGKASSVISTLSGDINNSHISTQRPLPRFRDSTLALSCQLVDLAVGAEDEW